MVADWAWSAGRGKTLIALLSRMVPPIVAEKAGRSISSVGLDALLYLIGVRDRDTFA